MAKKRTRSRGNGQGTLFKRGGRGVWMAQWYDRDGKRKEKSTRTTDKAAAQRILAKYVANTQLRREGVIGAAAEAITARSRRSITEALEAWRESLRARGASERRVREAFKRARRIANDCGFTALRDVEPGRVLRAIRDMQDEEMAPRTINAYLQAFGQFIGWAVAERRLSSDPLAGVNPVKVVGQTRNRRPLSAEELDLLIAETERSSDYKGLGGRDRAMLYRLAAGTGFRASELRSLTPGSFDLHDESPTVTVRAAYSKRRRDDRQPIRRDLAKRLRRWLAEKPRDEPVFRMPEKPAAMLRADLRRARARWTRAEATRPSVVSGARRISWRSRTPPSGWWTSTPCGRPTSRCW